jgi:hypothetical protein
MERRASRPPLQTAKPLLNFLGALRYREGLPGSGLFFKRAHYPASRQLDTWPQNVYKAHITLFPRFALNHARLHSLFTVHSLTSSSLRTTTLRQHAPATRCDTSATIQLHSCYVLLCKDTPSNCVRISQRGHICRANTKTRRSKTREIAENAMQSYVSNIDRPPHSSPSSSSSSGSI